MLYGSQVWALTLSEEHRSRVFGSKVLRRIFLPKIWNNRGKRKFHDKVLHNLYSLSCIFLALHQEEWDGWEKYHAW